MRDELKKNGEGGVYFINLFLFSTTKLYICKIFFLYGSFICRSGIADNYE